MCFQDAKAMLWDLNDDKHLYTLDHTDTINSLCFSPNRYWLCAATGPSIKIWVSGVFRDGLRNVSPRVCDPQIKNHSSDGNILFTTNKF